MINTWNESLLHEELKDLYCGENGQKEVPYDGSICDVFLNDGSIVEIQTANLGKLKRKLEKLLETRRVKLVYPLARNAIIETYNTDGTLKSRRKSPKHASIYSLFGEMTALYALIGHRNLEIEVVHADIQEIRVADGTGSWRRKGIRKDDRKLIKIHETQVLTTKKNWEALIPASLRNCDFTVKDLAQNGAGADAGIMVWVLRKAGILELAGKQGRAYVYRRVKKVKHAK
jgi:hypothetical protein